MFIKKLVIFLVKNPHIKHFSNSTFAFLKDFREKKDTLILKGLCRAFATYIPKFFLIKTTLKQDLVNVNEIRLNGYKRLSSLSEKQINELIDYFLSSSSEYYNQKFKNINELKNFMYKNKIQRSQIVLATKKNNPISAIVKTKEIFNTALSYLKSKPENLIYVSYIFALGKVESKALESKNALIFHRDVDHFKFLKFFYYLTDCPIGGGHHEYFTKTHRNIKFKVAPTKRYESNEIRFAYPEAELLKISGSQGFGFAEDTSGFHRGTPLENGFRVMLMIEVHPNSILRGGEIEFPTSVSYSKAP